MDSRVLALYHHMPPMARTLAASAQGWLLNRSRYGPETEQLVAQAFEHERWTVRQRQRWQEERLAYVLHRAATQVPYYREYWAARRKKGDRTSWEYLDNWPILEKLPLRENPRAFVADDCNVRHMVPESSSGTSGTPLTLWRSPATVRAWYALFEARARRWYGVSRRHPWAILGGRLVAPVAQSKPPFWVWNAPLRQLYMSSYHLSAEFIPSYLEALKKHRIDYLLGYSSSLEALAKCALEEGFSDFRPAVSITNAEPLSLRQRQTIERAFHCPVRETYGMAEIVAAASECRKGVMHLWPEVGWIEVLENGRPAASGELICTGLLNADMPLIRYRIGDRATVAANNGVCACGRTLPSLVCIEGREDDMLWTQDGRRIGRLDTVFKDSLPIQEAQIIQEALNVIRVRVVPAKNFNAATASEIEQLVKNFIGPVQVVLESVEQIPRGANGKFRAVICNLPPADRPVQGTFVAINGGL